MNDTTIFHNGPVLVNGAFQDDQVVMVRNGEIAHVGAMPDPGDAKLTDLGGDFLAPGFIDIQVNGGGGVLFNASPTTDAIRRIAMAHRQFGTTGLLPTLVSDDFEVIEAGMRAVADAIDQAVPGILGIHIEGPFLNIERRGIHDASKIRAITREWVERLQPLENAVTLITLAPDRVAPELVQALVDKGVIVSAGHSDATAEQVQRALDRGLRGFTHLYNAMSQLTAREPGMVGAALADRQSWCGLIADGHHAAPASMEIARRCKGADRLMLVTDAMPQVGTDQTEFELFGKTIRVENGVCVDDEGTLAGAALDMAGAVRNMTALTGATLAEACTMASTSPARFLGLERRLGRIAPGHRANLVRFDEGLQIKAALIGGKAD
jgi:N-acetylglucosamine-6-phosphate deacetylase